MKQLKQKSSIIVEIAFEIARHLHMLETILEIQMQSYHPRQFDIYLDDFLSNIAQRV
jgi:hypothetical protein